MNNMEELNKNFSQSGIPANVDFTSQLFVGEGMTCIDYFSLFFDTQKNTNQIQNKEEGLGNKSVSLCKQGLMLMDCFFFEGFFTKGFLKLDEKSN
jgi:hypothetical protein